MTTDKTELEKQEAEKAAHTSAPINRAERRKQIKFFSKMFKKHILMKPKVDITLEVEEAQTQVFAMRNWAITYGNLLKKLDTLGYDFKKDSEGIHKFHAEQGRLAARRLEETGSTSIGDLQLMRDPGQEQDGLPKE